MGVVKLIINEWPRSGGTWLRDCLAEILGWQGPEWNDEPTPPENTVTRVHRYPEAMPAGIPLIWLVRDPRDCVVSHYFMLRHHGDDFERPADLMDFIQNYFMKGGLGGLLAGGFTRFCEAWLSSKRKYILLPHEDVIANRFVAISWLLDELGFAVDEARIRTVTEEYAASTRPSYHDYDRNLSEQPPTIPSGSPSWCEFLEPEHLEILRDYCGEIVEKLGYYL